MTRVVAGSVGGRTLDVPPKGTRPTSERVREALFSRLGHLGVLDGARVLDLYAGSGALGIEAVSRGAAHATLVEHARVAADVCRRNVRALGLTDRVGVVAERAERFVGRPAVAPWDLVLVDPPYEVSDGDLAEVLAGVAGSLDPDAVLVVERAARSTEPTWPPGVERFDVRAYGDTRVWFAEPAHAGADNDTDRAPERDRDGDADGEDAAADRA
ncbi:16S rRNA (guanine(966)-N(2))-methyltransferase RsmD [Cellulomonas cellasea]|uniref:16S rRNA (Guanine966-N2)-methyltransferase n=1 Tax=Cellulomonas cellasea TaxID=43670 RepID=A0A7W4UBM5_9CELL|nr:16S rRNA (guanine(966)-N(2))-methyltransferase RsmD [Cellulomonas cellasea]MBB2921216.1 16S rRNA (guanine966-N2)-methyltransferase [Cellulomonas cellasea]